MKKEKSSTKNDNSWSTKTENREQVVRLLTYLLIAGMIYLLWLSYLISD